MPVLLGILLLVLVLWGLNGFAKANPQALARVLRPVGGIGAVAFAAFLGVRGELAVAIPLGLFGLGLLGWSPLAPAGFKRRTQKSAQQASRVRSAFLDMQLDHDSGALRGRFTAGPYVGRALDTIDTTVLIASLAEMDEESVALLEAYLDRREPGWREHAQGDTTAGHRPPSASGKMTKEEAYQILGLKPGASAQDIGRAHRSLMKKLHPDQGGSTYLAARVNEAKDTLLQRHS
jgi:hypothetical protein